MQKARYSVLIASPFGSPSGLYAQKTQSRLRIARPMKAAKAAAEVHRNFAPRCPLKFILVSRFFRGKALQQIVGDQASTRRTEGLAARIGASAKTCHTVRVSATLYHGGQNCQRTRQQSIPRFR